MKFLSESGVPEYAAIIFFVTGLLIAVNYPWVKNLYSSTKFRSLQTDIQDVMTTVAKDGN